MARFQKEKDSVIQKDVDDKIEKPTSIFTTVIPKAQIQAPRSKSVIHGSTTQVNGA